MYELSALNLRPTLLRRLQQLSYGSNRLVRKWRSDWKRNTGQGASF
jgi:hypothetical protein